MLTLGFQLETAFISEMLKATLLLLTRREIRPPIKHLKADIKDQKLTRSICTDVLLTVSNHERLTLRVPINIHLRIIVIVIREDPARATEFDQIRASGLVDHGPADAHRKLPSEALVVRVLSVICTVLNIMLSGIREQFLGESTWKCLTQT